MCLREGLYQQSVSIHLSYFSLPPSLNMPSSQIAKPASFFGALFHLPLCQTPGIPAYNSFAMQTKTSISMLKRDKASQKNVQNINPKGKRAPCYASGGNVMEEVRHERTTTAINKKYVNIRWPEQVLQYLHQLCSSKSIHTTELLQQQWNTIKEQLQLGESDSRRSPGGQQLLSLFRLSGFPSVTGSRQHPLSLCVEITILKGLCYRYTAYQVFCAPLLLHSTYKIEYIQLVRLTIKVI